MFGCFVGSCLGLGYGMFLVLSGVCAAVICVWVGCGGLFCVVFCLHLDCYGVYGCMVT